MNLLILIMSLFAYQLVIVAVPKPIPLKYVLGMLASSLALALAFTNYVSG